MVRTTIMAEKAMLEQISEIAHKTGKSKAHVIREALATYVAANKIDDKSTTEWPTNPLLSLLEFAESIEGIEMDVSDGKDEVMLREILGKRYEESQRQALQSNQEPAYASSG